MYRVRQKKRHRLWHILNVLLRVVHSESVPLFLSEEIGFKLSEWETDGPCWRVVSSPRPIVLFELKKFGSLK
jgi:hypothetical protein